jgi:hypothetical protein
MRLVDKNDKKQGKTRVERNAKPKPWENKIYETQNLDDVSKELDAYDFSLPEDVVSEKKEDVFVSKSIYDEETKVVAKKETRGKSRKIKQQLKTSTKNALLSKKTLIVLASSLSLLAVGVGTYVVISNQVTKNAKVQVVKQQKENDKAKLDQTKKRVEAYVANYIKPLKEVGTIQEVNVAKNGKSASVTIDYAPIDDYVKIEDLASKGNKKLGAKYEVERTKTADNLLLYNAYLKDASSREVKNKETLEIVVPFVIKDGAAAIDTKKGFGKKIDTSSESATSTEDSTNDSTSTSSTTSESVESSTSDSSFVYSTSVSEEESETTTSSTTTTTSQSTQPEAPALPQKKLSLPKTIYASHEQVLDQEYVSNLLVDKETKENYKSYIASYNLKKQSETQYLVTYMLRVEGYDDLQVQVTIIKE